MTARAPRRAAAGPRRRGRRASARLLLSFAALGMLLAVGCDDQGVRLGPKRAAPKGPDAGLSASDYELDLKLLGGRRQRVVAAVKGRDVRALLPRRPLSVKAGQRAFAVVPIARRWERVEWRAVRVRSLEPEASATVELEEGRRFAGVPAALLFPAGRERPRVGQVVRVGIGRGLPFGRVIRVAGNRVTVHTVWLGALREAEVSLAEVLLFPTGQEPGAPVVYRLQTSHRLGSLLAAERKHRWVLGAEGVIHRLPWTDVVPVALGKPFAPGAPARAALPVSLRPVTVVKALDGGVRYEVAWGLARRRVVGFASLVPSE